MKNGKAAAEVVQEVDVKKIDPRMARLLESANLSLKLGQQQTDGASRVNKRRGLLLAGFVIGLYVFSMYRVKQEDFLKDLDKKVEKDRAALADK